MKFIILAYVHCHVFLFIRCNPVKKCSDINIFWVLNFSYVSLLIQFILWFSCWNQKRLLVFVTSCWMLLNIPFFFVLCTCIIMLYALAVKIARFSNANHLRFARWRWLSILCLLPFLFLLWTCTLLNFIFSELYILVIVVNFVEDAKCWLSGFWYSRCFFPKKCILSISYDGIFPSLLVYMREHLLFSVVHYL